MSETLTILRRRLPPLETTLIGAALAVLLLVGWRLTAMPGAGGTDAAFPARIEALEQKLAAVEGLEPRLRGLEQRPVGDVGGRVAALEQRVAALAQRPTTDLAPQLAALEQRLAGLERRPDPAPRLAELERRQPVDLGPLERRLAALEARPSYSTQLEARFAEQQASLSGNFRTLYAELRLHARTLEALRVRLAAGQPLGEVLEAGSVTAPALLRFATEPPPTEARLRLRFDDLARAVRGTTTATRPDGFWDTLWQALRGLVTVRRGDEVILGGDADAGLARIAGMLQAGDLAAAAGTVGELPPGARTALAPWLAEVQALLAARAAIDRFAEWE
jgi:hypothetical protein